MASEWVYRSRYFNHLDKTVNCLWSKLVQISFETSHKGKCKKETTKTKLKDNNNLGLSTSTINRNITALKVLFKYLSKSSNNPLGKPYLENNPMDQVATITDKTTLAARANAIEKNYF